MGERRESNTRRRAFIYMYIHIYTIRCVWAIHVRRSFSTNWIRYTSPLCRLPHRSIFVPLLWHTVFQAAPSPLPPPPPPPRILFVVYRDVAQRYGLRYFFCNVFFSYSANNCYSIETPRAFDNECPWGCDIQRVHELTSTKPTKNYYELDSFIMGNDFFYVCYQLIDVNKFPI